MPLLAATLACSISPITSGEETETASSVPLGARTLTEDKAYYRHPEWSPDGSMIASLRSPFVSEEFSPPTQGDVILIEVSSGTQQTLAAPELFKPGLAGGPVFWLEDGRAVAFYYFDFLGGQVTPTIIQYELETAQAGAVEVCCAPFTATSDSSEFLINMSTDDSFGIGWLDLESGQTRSELIIRREGPRDHVYVDFSLSPNGQTLLLGDVEDQIFVYEIGSGSTPELFLTEAVTPAWHPEGSALAYIDLSGGADYYSGQIAIANADGSSPQSLFPGGPHRGMLEPAWSPDGSKIAFLYGGRTRNMVLVTDVPGELQP